MGWKTLDEAAKTGPSRSTWERRIEGNRVAHYLDAASGRRMVWIDAAAPEPPSERDLGELRRTVAELRTMIGELRRERAPGPRLLPRRRPAPPIRGRNPISIPRPAPRVRAGAPAPVPEEEIARIMAKRAECPLGDKALQRAAGLASNWFWKVKRGQCRSALATSGWERLDAFLSTSSRRRAA